MAEQQNLLQLHWKTCDKHTKFYHIFCKFFFGKTFTIFWENSDIFSIGIGPENRPLKITEYAQQLAYLLATALKYFKYAEYTEFSSCLLFDPSSENTGFKICITAFRVNVVWEGLNKCTKIGNTLPICKENMEKWRHTDNI